MKRLFYDCISVLTAVVLIACNSGSTVNNEQFAFLDKLGITVTDELLLGDSLSLPDVYCGDKRQQEEEVPGKALSQSQYQALIVPVDHDIPDAMSYWVLMGVSDVGGGITLAAYYAGNGVGYCVNLVTYDKQGRPLDAMNARELHLLWRVNLSDASNDSVYTLDSHFALAGDKMTLYRTMGRCIMDFQGDLKSAPLWQQTWQQDYVINAKGHFVLQGQRVIKESGEVDQYAALDFKSWDMLVCSLHDPDIMDTWNNYTELVNSTYDADYKYNPFPWDVAELYRMNPQRFLRWMAAPQHQNNRLLPCFKLPPHDRPALLEEISRLEDPAARQRLTALVNSWDDKPLTKHL